MASPQPVTLATLTALLSNHHAKLSALYGLFSPAPQPLVEAHLSPLQAMLAPTIDQQLAAAEREVSSAEERLALGWKRVHEWQTALGEPLRAEKKRGDGPLISLVEDVDRIKESMKSRMQERGQRILELQRNLRMLAEVVGREWLEISLDEAAEQDDDRWEDLDLTQNRMTALEREIVRCESEIVGRASRPRPSPFPLAGADFSATLQAHRKELLDSDANEIFALRCELGLYQETTDSACASTSVDPVDEEILWHLGIGERRQDKKEMRPTAENVQKLEAKRKWVRLVLIVLTCCDAGASPDLVDATRAAWQQLEDEKDSRNETIQTTYDKLYPLWTMLGVTEEEMDEFVNQNMGSTMEVVNAVRSRCCSPRPSTSPWPATSAKADWC